VSSPATPRSGDRPDETVHDSPLRRWCRFLEKISSRNAMSGQASSLKSREWLIALAVIVWIKWAVGLGGWSGMSSMHTILDMTDFTHACTGKGYPPLYGDMEAQRHWLSLVSHLPPSQWYFHNLKHWGLDYPPLTAYHSWLLAQIAKLTGNGQVAELRGRLDGRETVHGEENALLFMRSTVIAGDLLLWAVPVALWCAHVLGRWRQSESGSSKRSSRTMVSRSSYVEC
jgi:alpha-1,3-glucosyltransferase